MKIADKIKIMDKEYMCIQVIFLENIEVYRMHEVIGNNEIFVMKKDKEYKEVSDKKVLQEIKNLLKVKEIDLIIK